ncbi:MAG: hypothetical protein JW867_03130, partial [Candidatus Omnitrophica bacterium]|nr:hypothetical protein [Candidatus Omnitrophota bacterium]
FGHGSLLDRLPQRFLEVKKSISLYIKREIAFDIADDLLLIDMARALSQNSSSVLYNIDLTLLLDKKNYWSEYVFRYADSNKVKFYSIKHFAHKANRTVQFFYHFFRTIAEYLCSFFMLSPDISKNKENKIGLPYYHFPNFIEVLNKRNYYLFWLRESQIDPRRIIIYSDGPIDIDLNEKEKLDKKGIKALACNWLFKKIPKYIKKHKPGPGLMVLLMKNLSLSLKLLFSARSRADFSLCQIISVLLIRLPYWQDFFEVQNIKIKFRWHAHFSHREIAAKLCGAATVSYHYSNVSEATIDLTSQCIDDVYFVWGKEHQRCFINKHSDIKNIIHSGYIFDYTFKAFKDKADSLRNQLAGKGVRFVINLMTENIVGIRRSGMLQFCRALFDFILKNKDTGLIIKPKMRLTKNILDNSRETGQLSRELQQEGRLIFLDSSKYPVEAAKSSDLSIGVFADSTASLECVLAGIPTVIYECCFGEHMDHPYYREYRNKIIFYDINELLKTITAYKQNKQSCSGFADWSSIIKERDSFCDGLANIRIGGYIKGLLNQFDSGLLKDNAIEKTNSLYADKFGQDKVVVLS